VTDGVPFQSLEVKIVHEKPYDPSWPTVDNLYVGSDPNHTPVPEPSAFMLLSLGLCGVGTFLLRKEA
jgi:hypothetical protein